MKLKSFSKINLSLSINKKFKKGLHDIQSYFCLINLFDIIEIKRIKKKKDIIKFKGRFAQNVKKKENSVKTVLRILRQKNLIKNNYLIIIDKKIPVFAGLGGGTSNAACLVRHFVKKKINKDLFEILSKKIGSDLNLFQHNQGFLENLKTIRRLKKSYNLFFLLVYTNIKSSTRDIYSKVSKFSTKSKYNYQKINNKEKFISLLKNSKNDLQFIVEKKYPKIKNLILKIGEKKGCYFSRITGSGSVCYGIFQSEKTAKFALKRIKLEYPNYWSAIVKTI